MKVLRWLVFSYAVNNTSIKPPRLEQKAIAVPAEVLLAYLDGHIEALAGATSTASPGARVNPRSADDWLAIARDCRAHKPVLNSSKLSTEYIAVTLKSTDVLVRVHPDTRHYGHKGKDEGVFYTRCAVPTSHTWVQPRNTSTVTYAPSYPEVARYILGRTDLTETQKATLVRDILTGSAPSGQTVETEFKTLVVAAFVAETARNYRALPVGLMLLDLVETGATYDTHHGRTRTFVLDRIFWRRFESELLHQEALTDLAKTRKDLQNATPSWRKLIQLQNKTAPPQNESDTVSLKSIQAQIQRHTQAIQDTQRALGEFRRLKRNLYSEDSWASPLTSLRSTFSEDKLEELIEELEKDLVHMQQVILPELTTLRDLKQEEAQGDLTVRQFQKDYGTLQQHTASNDPVRSSSGGQIPQSGFQGATTKLLKAKVSQPNRPSVRYGKDGTTTDYFGANSFRFEDAETTVAKFKTEYLTLFKLKNTMGTGELKGLLLRPLFKEGTVVTRWLARRLRPRTDITVTAVAADTDLPTYAQKVNYTQLATLKANASTLGLCCAAIRQALEERCTQVGCLL